MSSSNAEAKKYKEVKTILISQPKPERSPYRQLENKYGIKIDYRPFIHVEPVTEKEFRKTRIRPDQFSAVILTSRNAIQHFFRMCEEMRIEMSQDTKYFCLSEAVAHYLQKFIIYRKRKVFVGKRHIEDLSTALNKHRANEKFLLPCSNLGSKPVVKYLSENEFDFQEAMMYRTVSSDLSDLRDIFYDVLVFFSPLGIKSLYENFPDFKQNETRIAVFGNSTLAAVKERGLTINIHAPAPETPSMTMALEKYIMEANK
ncbi:MAG: uroporphyrinogen-III synthase [Saprospiraceae bacterium]|nr:uroporphyrinogen-III synthase [Saprospiraceae bacterium]